MKPGSAKDPDPADMPDNRNRVEPIVPPSKHMPASERPKARDIREVDTNEYDESNDDESNAGEGPD